MRKIIRKTASRTIQGITYLFACLLWEDSEGKKTGICLAKSLSGTHSSSSVFLDTEDDYPDESPRGEVKMPPFLSSFVLHFAFFIGLDLPSQLYHCVSMYIVLTNASLLGITKEVNWRDERI